MAMYFTAPIIGVLLIHKPNYILASPNLSHFIALLIGEVPDTINVDELGDLGLTLEEEAAIVAFMKTLSDGYVP